jgi:hypothetical protein
MVFFKPLIIPSTNQDPFKNSKIYQLKKTKLDFTYNDRHFEKLTYKKQHGLCWRISNVGFLILACLIVYPLIKDRQCLKKIVKRIKTGEEIKIVLIAQKQSIVDKNNPAEKKNEQQPIPSKLVKIPSKLVKTEKKQDLLLNAPNVKKTVKAATFENKREQKIELLELPKFEKNKNVIIQKIAKVGKLNAPFKSCLKQENEIKKKKNVHFDQYADLPSKTPYKIIYDQIDIDTPYYLIDNDDEDEEEDEEEEVLNPSPKIPAEQAVAVKPDQVKVEVKVEEQQRLEPVSANQQIVNNQQKVVQTPAKTVIENKNVNQLNKPEKDKVSSTDETNSQPRLSWFQKKSKILIDKILNPNKTKKSTTKKS